jgi:ADP-ribose pyrophosphatase
MGVTYSETMKVKIKHTWLEHDGFVKVEKAQLQFEKFNGEMSAEVFRHRYHRTDAVAVMIHDPANRSVLLVRQFRYAVYANNGEGWLTECVAGMMEAGERPEDVARREVLEETGLCLKSAELLAEYFFSPGGCSNKLHLFLGEVECSHLPLKVAGLAHENEETQPEWVPLDEALQMVGDGRITDGKTLIGLMLLDRRLRKENEAHLRSDRLF